jgi:feruloyl esterase
MAVCAGLGAVGSLAQVPQGRGRAGGPGGPPAPPPPLQITLRPLATATAPTRTCESLTSLTIANTTIEAAAVEPAAGPSPALCRVTAVVTHPPAGDRVRVWLALPMTGWNGRFQGVGGGGFSGGSMAGVRNPALQGFAAGSTDTGHEGGSGSFALDASNRLNWMLIRDNAYLGIHEMTVLGKAVTQAFYGAAPVKSYFNGCSTGGRQGLSEAQRYPGDYDGILSGAPAINWTKLHVEQLWGHVVMTSTNTIVPQCKFQAATTAAIAACDRLDGVGDGVIEDPRRCTYDPKPLVGTPTECGVITEADANVIRKIWDGPRRQDGSFLWYGLTRGTAFSGLSNTAGTPLESRPNGITLDWWRYFLMQDPKWDPNTITVPSYEHAWDQSVEQYGPVFGTDTPDLSAFRARGGKIVMWHGQNDPLIYPGGSIDYYERVQRQMGGARPTAEFFRFFLAPGVGHCSGGTGPAPSGQFEAVIRWVEDGVAPETLNAVRRDQTGTVTRTRPLCQYPLVARYRGTGSTDEAASFTCATGF